MSLYITPNIMTKINPDDYLLLGFEVSKNPNKKYDAILLNKNTSKTKRVGFGSKNPLMEQYRDTTGLGVYSNLDHNDKKRLASYRARFKNDQPKYSPNYFSWNYLWC